MKTIVRKSRAKAKVSPFIKRAERAFERVAKQVTVDYQAKKLVPATWGEADSSKKHVSAS